MIFVSCYTRKDGCLDKFSVNFDASADDMCETCCEFPSVSLGILSINGLDSNYTISDTIINNNNDSFRILDAKFYLSGVSIYQSGIAVTSVLTMIDSLQNQYIDDVLFLRPQDKTINFPGFRYQGQPDSVIVHVGLTDEILTGRFNTVGTSHPLHPRNKLETENNEPAYANIQFVAFRNSIKDTIQVSLGLKTLYSKRLWSVVSPNRLGSNLSVNVVADYQNLFKDFDLNNPSKIEIVMKKNINDFFRVY